MEDKNDKLYYSISEVAAMFNLNESSLRFWEKEFDIIDPRKTDRGTRYYDKKDIDNISLIYHLLKEKGMTLAGAKKKLKENKEGTAKTHEIVKRLKEIRQEIIDICDEMQ
jgi:Predicted transcriptional regulators